MWDGTYVEHSIGKRGRWDPVECPLRITASWTNWGISTLNATIYEYPKIYLASDCYLGVRLYIAKYTSEAKKLKRLIETQGGPQIDKYLEDLVLTKLPRAKLKQAIAASQQKACDQAGADMQTAIQEALGLARDRS